MYSYVIYIPMYVYVPTYIKPKMGLLITSIIKVSFTQGTQSHESHTSQENINNHGCRVAWKQWVKSVRHITKRYKKLFTFHP